MKTPKGFAAVIVVGSFLAIPVPTQASHASATCEGRAHETLVAEQPMSRSLAGNASACMRVGVANAAPFLKVTLNGPGGTAADLDLFVRFGSPASSSAFDCRPISRESTETCNFDNPAQGDWFVMVVAVGSGGSFHVKASMTSCVTLVPGVTRTSSTTRDGEIVCFTFNAPEGTEGIKVSVSASPSVYGIGMRFDRPLAPEDNFGCSYTCVRWTSVASPWFVAVKSTTTPGPFEISLEFISGDCKLVTAGNTTFAKDIRCYEVDVPPGTDLLRLSSTGRVSFVRPDGSTLCALKDSVCSIPGPEAERLSIQGYPPSSFGVYFEQAIVVDRTAQGVAWPGYGAMYRFDELNDAATIALADRSDVKLSVRRGAPPTLTKTDCISDQPSALPQEAPPPPLTGTRVSLGTERCDVEAGNGPIYAFVTLSRLTRVWVEQRFPFGPCVCRDWYHNGFVITGAKS